MDFVYQDEAAQQLKLSLSRVPWTLTKDQQTVYAEQSTALLFSPPAQLTVKPQIWVHPTNDRSRNFGPPQLTAAAENLGGEGVVTRPPHPTNGKNRKFGSTQLTAAAENLGMG